MDDETGALDEPLPPTGGSSADEAAAEATVEPAADATAEPAVDVTREPAADAAVEPTTGVQSNAVQARAPVAPAISSGDRDPALVLAGLHLRLGSLALARVELETLAASARLDRPGRVDLAEVRWRTGDLLAAGTAARESLASGGPSVVALVVAAEAASALGRPTEARKLATQAQAMVDGSIDAVFAGMPRSGVWPADPSEPVPSPTTLFPTDRATPGSGLASDADGRAGARDGTSAGGPPGAIGRAAAVATMPATHGDERPSTASAAPASATRVATPDHGPGFWDDLPEAESPPPEAPPAPDIALPRDPNPPDGLDLVAVLDAGEAALAAGDYATAALHLGLVVRVAPAIAPAVLAAIGETPDAGLQMVRGDAYRVLGREVDARRAYELAMTAAAAAEVRPGGGDQAGLLGTTIPIDRWDPASWAPSAPPTPPPDPTSAASDDVEPPPFLLSRPWPGMAARRTARGEPADGQPAQHHEPDPPPAGSRSDDGPEDPVDPDDDRDPFAGEP